MKTFSGVCMVVVALVAGCGSDADNLTLDGVDDLKNCDIRSAREKFADAYDSDRSHPQAALGFALTSMALLPEDPKVTAILMRFGFTSALDMQTLVFGANGALARHARGDTCESINMFVDNTIPYPATTIDEWTLIDASLTGNDIAAAADSMSPQLAEIAAALETAATGMTAPIEVDGGCGIGKVTFQAPELFAMAAIIEGMRSFIQLGQAYDWGVSIRRASEIWNGDARVVAALLNEHIGRVIAAGEGSAARPIMVRAVGLFVRAVDAAKVATVQPDGLFNWTAMPVSLLDGARKLGVAVEGMLDGATTIPDVMPTLTLDLTSVFATPIDLQSFGVPFAEALDEFFWDWSDQVIEQALTPLFSPNPFVDNGTIWTWTFGDQWSVFDETPVTMPFDRYDAVYQCMTTPFCGDGFCDVGETVTSCPGDC